MRPVPSEHAEIPQPLVGNESQRMSMQQRCVLHRETSESSWDGAGCGLAGLQAITIRRARPGRCVRHLSVALSPYAANFTNAGCFRFCRSVRNVQGASKRLCRSQPLCGPYALLLVSHVSSTGPVGFDCLGRLSPPFRDAGGGQVVRHKRLAVLVVHLLLTYHSCARVPGCRLFHPTESSVASSIHLMCPTPLQSVMSVPRGLCSCHPSSGAASNDGGLAGGPNIDRSARSRRARHQC